MRKFFQVTIAASLSALLVVVVIANAQPGVIFKRSADFTGTGSSGSPMELSTDVTMPGKAAIAGVAGSSSLTVASTDQAAITVTRTASAVTSADTGSIYATETGTYNTSSQQLFSYGVRGASLGSRSAGANDLNNWGVYGLAKNAQVNVGVTGIVTNSSIGVATEDVGVLGVSDGIGTNAYAVRGVARGGANTNYGVFGTASGGSTNYSGYFDAGAFHVEGASDFDNDATFEDDVCVINSLGITCSGTLLTPGADITGVTAGNGLTGGGSSGAVTLDVAVGTGLSVAADAVNLNLAGASCGANEFVSAISSTGTGTCTAASTGITNSAGANVIPKSDGTNLVASGLTDDGTTVTTSRAITASIAGGAMIKSLNATNSTGSYLSGTVVCSGNATAISNSCPSTTDGVGWARLTSTAWGVTHDSTTLATNPSASGWTVYSNTAANDVSLQWVRIRGTPATPTIAASADRIGRIRFSAAHTASSSSSSDGVEIRALVDGTPAGASNVPGRLEVYTSAASGAAGPVRRWYVDAAGKMFALFASDFAGAAVFQSTVDITGLLTATAGGTTPANWTTTGSGDLVSGDDLTVTDDAVISDTLAVTGNASFAGTVTLGDSTTTDIVIVKGGEFADGGTVPSAGTCGTSPTWAGGRNAFRVTAGTGGPTSCATTFSTAYAATPVCVVTAQSNKAVYISALSTTAITIANVDGASMEGIVYHIHCIGDA